MSVHELQPLVKAKISESLPYHTTEVLIVGGDNQAIEFQASNIMQITSVLGACDPLSYKVRELQYAGRSLEDLASAISTAIVKANHRPTQGQPHVVVTLRPVYNHIGGVLSCMVSITFSTN